MGAPLARLASTVITPRARTVLGSVRLNGQTAHTTYTGGTTGQRFLEYLKDILIPALHKGDIVVMDKYMEVPDCRTLAYNHLLCAFVRQSTGLRRLV